MTKKNVENVSQSQGDIIPCPLECLLLGEKRKILVLKTSVGQNMEKLEPGSLLGRKLQNGARAVEKGMIYDPAILLLELGLKKLGSKKMMHGEFQSSIFQSSLQVRKRSNPGPSWMNRHIKCGGCMQKENIICVLFLIHTW